mgnify:CR=1 FL=1
MALVLFAGCGSDENKIVGTWKGYVNTGILNTSVNVEYTFNEDGTGKMPLLSSGINIDVNFTYTIEDSVLTIVTDTAILSQTKKYGLSFEGDSMILVDENNEKLVFTKAE